MGYTQPKAWRYLYRKVHSNSMGWYLLGGTCALNTTDGAWELVYKWNDRDRDRWEWKVEECLPGDFDHPDQLKT